MNSTVIAAIQTFTLQARDWLETEVGEQLEGVYGWLPGGELNPAQQYPALKAIPEAAQTRKDLECYIAESREAGIHAADARRKLLRETAFTWLNRLVALHMLEERRLIRASVSRLAESNAYLYWLADEFDPTARQLHDQGELPLNLMGEGPRHVAYRRFLLWQCGQLAKDVSVIFSPDTLSSRLFPRHSVLKAIVEAMNDEQIIEAWQAGNEETVGWVYQSFNAEELQAAFTSAREQGKKFAPEDIPSVTQLFTLRWVVRFLVENTLGRLWLEMHPDSQFDSSLAYLAPGKAVRPRSVKLVRDIRFLDPACGSMHFGLVAFDLFAAMYREELRNEGKTGWPTQASIASEDEIPAAIIRHNLYGIDIDLRAVQLSALTLFLRAKSMNSACLFTERNLACANIQHITGGRLDGFVKAASWTHPIQKRIVTALAEQLADSDNLGSLLRVETYLRELISAERKQARHSMDALFADDKFGSDEEMEAFFETIDRDVAQKLDEFVRQSRTDGRDASYFASEASKGLRFMRLVQKHYDVVATNPPYLSNRKMNKQMADLLEKQYPNAKTDMYAAFIVRCSELVNQNGLLGMLTMHSFMFIGSYEDLRSKMVENYVAEVLAHFGGGLFAVGNPGTLQTAAFVLRRESNPAVRAAHVGSYFRLVHEKNAEAKRLAFEAALAALKTGQSHPQVFFAKMSQFEAIPEKPWSYCLPKSIYMLFQDGPLMGSLAPAIHGTTTYDVFRFTRFWWECGVVGLCRNADSWTDFILSCKQYVPYMKGGRPPVAWYGNQQNCLRLLEGGNELKAYLRVKRDMIRGSNYNFKPGITWSLIGKKKFNARLTPPGFMFDVAGTMCFPPTDRMYNVLAILNSRLARYVLFLLNSTINNTVGDIERLPIPNSHSASVDDLVAQCVELARQNSRESEITCDFVTPLAEPSVVLFRKETLAEMERKIDEAVSELYGLSEEDLATIDRELSAAKAASSEDVAESDDEEEAEEEKQAVTPANWARSWLSYAVGIVMGRFEIGTENGLGCGTFSAAVAGELRKLAVTDGILVNDAGEPLDLSGRVWQALILMLGEAGAKSRVQAALGAGNPQDLLRSWLNRFSGAAEESFWKQHHQQYKKRPVYWPLQSPKRRYTIWLFHERLTGDTLFHIRGNIVEPRLALALRQADDLKVKAQTDRLARKERDELLGLVDDLREFSKRLKQITEQGYAPHIDDGVLLNAAPLHEVLPSWSDCAKAWKELADGKLDWAHQAMAYWPGRVEQKCKTDASLAIAHGKDKK